MDNGSHDESAQMVASEFQNSNTPAVHLLASDENLGFTGGNNLGLAYLGFDVPIPKQFATAELGRQRTGATSSPLNGRAGPHPRSPQPLPDFVLLLNPDAEVTDGALFAMAHFLQQTSGAGACGARLQYGDGRFQHGAFCFPSLAQIVLDFFPLTGLPGAHRLHDSRANGRYPRRLWASGRPFVVDFVLGAAMMVAGQAITEVGGLDDAYFMYCEEMDWCLRLAEAGWSVYAVPSARVIHHEGQSSRKVRWQAYEWLWRSRFRFYARYRRRYPPGYLAAVRGLVRLGVKVRAAQAHRRFGRGEINGVELHDELTTYAAVARL
ncbi:MAG: glycosyltransferase family 2 protein [Caldilineaceae bacterium]|nr:glycosyltransferase family 2 protein [Caldilineaceae bacterium]